MSTSDETSKRELRPRGAVWVPGWLSENGKKEYRRLAPELRRLGMLTSLDWVPFAASCAAIGTKKSYASQMKLIRLVPIVLLVTGLLSAQDFIAKCVGVTDGDTITVLVGLEQMKIRLGGIDTPETGQDFANRAKQFTSRLVFGKHVHILPKEKDRYGRLVARVRVDDTDVSLELVKAWSGLALQKVLQRPRISSGRTAGPG